MFGPAWVCPVHKDGPTMVSPVKLGACFLLMLLSHTMVAALRRIDGRRMAVRVTQVYRRYSCGSWLPRDAGLIICCERVYTWNTNVRRQIGRANFGMNNELKTAAFSK